MKSKYWAIVLCAVVLVLGIVACGNQASQEPQEPAQQSEPVTTTEPAKPPVETAPQEEPKQPEVTAPIEVKESDPVDEVVETVPVESTPEPAPVSTQTPSQKPAETKPQEVPQQGGGEIDTSGDRDAFINSLNEIRKQNGGSEGADHAITPEEAAGIAQSVSLEVGGQQPSADGDSSGELTPEQQQQSIADALAGLTTQDPDKVCKPGDPDWDDYVSGLAGSLQPTN